MFNFVVASGTALSLYCQVLTVNFEPCSHNVQGCFDTYGLELATVHGQVSSISHESKDYYDLQVILPTTINPGHSIVVSYPPDNFTYYPKTFQFVVGDKAGVCMPSS